jgi:hypothetical protein
VRHNHQQAQNFNPEHFYRIRVCSFHLVGASLRHALQLGQFGGIFLSQLASLKQSL